MERRTRRRIFIGAKGTAPKRIPLEILEDITRQLRASLARVAADLGSSPGERTFELVDLVAGSAGLVLEESSPIDAPSALAVTLDALAARSDARSAPALLTPSAMVAIDELLEMCRSMAGRGWTVRLEPDTESGRASHAFIEITADEMAVRVDDARPEDLPPMKAAALVLSAATWLIEFDGVVERLDEPTAKMWVRVDGKLLSGLRLGRDLFETVDSDDARWKRVRIVAKSRSPQPSAAIEVLSVVPAPDTTELVAVPIDGQAERLVVLIERIASFRNLKQGWDSYGAAPVKAVSMRAAREFVALADAYASGRKKILPLPFVAPTSRGGVHLEWELGDELFLSIEFVDGETIDSVRIAGEQVVEATAKRGYALELVGWLMARWS